MKKYLLGGLGLIILLLAITYWALQPKYFYNGLAELNNVDQVKIQLVTYDDQHEVSPIKIVSRSEEIALIIEKFHTYSDNWTDRGFTPPPIAGKPASVQIIFFENDAIKTFFSIGYDKQTSYFIQEHPKYHGRYLSDSEFKDLMSFLEIDEKFVYSSDHQN
jgi:hypothetical protein